MLSHIVAHDAVILISFPISGECLSCLVSKVIVLLWDKEILYTYKALGFSSYLESAIYTYI